MFVSNRVNRMAASAVRQLVPFAKEAEQKGIKIYHLNIGQPDIQTPTNFYERLHNFDDKVLSYSDSKGMAELIQAFADYYKIINFPFTTNDIIITNGASESLLFAMLTLCDHGDNILVTEPFYTNYKQLGTIAGVEFVPVTTYPEEGYALPAKDAFLAKINSRTRAILLSNPANPTGRVLTAAEMECIKEVALEKNLWIISDEVYREFCYQGTIAQSFACFPELTERVVVIDSISKRYSACGARIGVIAAKNKKLTEAFLKLAQSRLSVSTVSQVGAIALMKTPMEEIYADLQEYKRRRDTCYAEFAKIPGVICRKPEGAFYMMVKLPVDDVTRLATFLLRDFNLDGETTMIAPGEGFYATPGFGKQETRIAYVLGEEKLRKAIRIIAAGIEAYPGKIATPYLEAANSR